MEYYLNGNKLQNEQPFTVGEFTYPWSFLEISSREKLTSMGITQINKSSTFDSRYYWDADLPKQIDDREEVDPTTNEPLYVKVWDPTFDNGGDISPGAMVNTEERLVSKGLKTTCTAEIKQTAGSILAKTDWYLYRLAEREVEVPENIATHRAAIIAESDRLETAIAAVTDVEELIAVMNTQDWDDSPNPTV
jgi:hypothetical protein